MPTPAIVLDGTMAYGTQSVTINSVVYLINNVKVARAVGEAHDEGVDGRPARNRYTAGVDELTGELQLATSATAYPAFGGTFTLTLDSNYGSETWIVMPTDAEQSNSATEIRVAPLKAKKATNPSSVTTVS
jgi:hypothetical protein